MNITCVQINIFLFIAHFAEALHPLAGYYAERTAMKEGGMLIGAYCGESPCGALIAKDSGSSVDVMYVAVAESHRRKGAFKAMIGECADIALRGGKKSVRLRYIPSEGGGDWLDLYLHKAGFTKHRSMMTVVIALTGDVKNEWYAFAKGRGGRIIEKLEQKGFEASCFTETPLEIMEKLQSGMGNKFPPYLDPFNSCNAVLDKYCFIATHKSEPAAYTVITSADGGKTVNIEYMASSTDYRGKGAFLVCLAASLDKIFRSGAGKLSFAYSESNKALPVFMTSSEWFAGKTVRPVYDYSLSLLALRITV